MKKTIYTFFDLLGSLLLKTFEKSPYIIKVIILPIAITPILLLCILAEKKGWKTEDVL